MKVTVYGTGYVGLVTGACLADAGHRVLCADVDRRRVDNLNQGIIPIYEPGLEPIVRQALANGSLQFTADMKTAVHHGPVQMIAVGTPSDTDGSASLAQVEEVARTIGKIMDDHKLLITKSTVPVGTAERVRGWVTEQLTRRKSSQDFDVASNPEFLKEGAAIADFMKPDRIVLGIDNPRVEKTLRELYGPFNRVYDRILFMDLRSAELTKYAANAMLATKISFINEMANIAERLGADIENVRIGIGADQRIGYHFIYPGCGYGGSCFPKDIKALIHMADGVAYEPQLMTAVDRINRTQKTRLFSYISDYFRGELRGKTIALWGLAFKPGTDDMREAPSRVLMETLWAAGARIRAYDPVAMDQARKLYGRRPGLVFANTKEEALRGADVLAICTEWKNFRAPDFELIRQTLRRPVIFDGRNLYDPKHLCEMGIIYYAIGRGQSLAQAKELALPEYESDSAA